MARRGRPPLGGSRRHRDGPRLPGVPVEVGDGLPAGRPIRIRAQQRVSAPVLVAGCPVRVPAGRRAGGRERPGLADAIARSRPRRPPVRPARPAGIGAADPARPARRGAPVFAGGQGPARRARVPCVLHGGLRVGDGGRLGSEQGRRWPSGQSVSHRHAACTTTGSRTCCRRWNTGHCSGKCGWTTSCWPTPS